MRFLSLAIFLMFCNLSKANIITVQFNSLSQPPQDIYMNICDTLVVNNTSGYSYFMLEDTIGSANNTYIFPDSLSPAFNMGEGFFFDLYEVNDGTAYICHQIFTLLFIIHINPASNTTINATICSGQSYSFNGQSLTNAGDYQEYIPAAQGCDSVTNLHLEVLPPPASTTQISICSGASYTFNNQTFYDPGIHPVILQNSSGCDSIANLELIVSEPVITNVYEAICHDDTLLFLDNVYTNPGEFDHILQATNGCDSIVRLILSQYLPLYPEISAVNDTFLVSNFPDQFGYELSWTDCISNTILPGETADFLNVSENGSYGLIVNYEGCAYYSECYAVSTVEMSENATINIQIAPNPTSDKISIKTTLPIPLNVTIHDLSGKVHFSQSYTEKSAEMDVSGFTPGFYLLTVNDQTFRIEIGIK